MKHVIVKDMRVVSSHGTTEEAIAHLRDDIAPRWKELGCNVHYHDAGIAISKDDVIIQHYLIVTCHGDTCIFC